MTDARAQVRITFFSRVKFNLSILAFSGALMNGPFLVDLLIYFWRPFFSLRRMVSLFEAFLVFRVREPIAGVLQGAFGLPPRPVLPSPPPWGWSTGVIVQALTAGPVPSPALRACC